MCFQHQKISLNILPSVALVCAKTIFNLFPVEFSSEHPGPWDIDPIIHLKTRMAVQEEIKQNLCNGYLKLGQAQQNLKF